MVAWTVLVSPSQCLPDQRELPNELSESVEKERKHKQTRAWAEIVKKPVIDPCRYERWLNLVQVTAYMYFEVLKLSSQKQVQVTKNCQSRSYRRQVILVTTDTMGGAPSRVWKAGEKHSFAKHQCYLEVGSLLWQERSVATGRRKIAVLADLPEGT